MSPTRQCRIPMGFWSKTFTWWNGATWGTQVWTSRFGDEVGKDDAGNVYYQDKKDPGRVGFVRHHAFAPRFEVLGDQWFLVVSPSYHFTTNGFIPHSFPDALLSGKKRLDNSASLRGTRSVLRQG